MITTVIQHVNSNNVDACTHRVAAYILLYIKTGKMEAEASLR